MGNLGNQPIRLCIDRCRAGIPSAIAPDIEDTTGKSGHQLKSRKQMKSPEKSGENTAPSALMFGHMLESIETSAHNVAMMAFNGRIPELMVSCGSPVVAVALESSPRILAQAPPQQPHLMAQGPRAPGQLRRASSAKAPKGYMGQDVCAPVCPCRKGYSDDTRPML